MRNTWRITRQRIPQGSTARRNQIRPKIKTFKETQPKQKKLVIRGGNDSSYTKLIDLLRKIMSSDRSIVNNAATPRFIPHPPLCL